MLDLTSRTILIVDDEPELLEIMSQILEMRGAKVLTAKNGIQALTVWSENQQVDLIMTDVAMPGKDADGISLVKKIRAVSSGKPPIIMITGYSRQSEAAALAAGAAVVFAKPFRTQEIESAIGRLLEEDKNQNKG